MARTPRTKRALSTLDALSAKVTHTGVGQHRDSGAGVLDALAELEAWDERAEHTDDGHLLDPLIRSPRVPKERVSAITEIAIGALQPIPTGQPVQARLGHFEDDQPSWLQDEVGIPEEETTRGPTDVLVSEEPSASATGKINSALDYALGATLDDERLPTAEVVSPTGNWVSENPQRRKECLQWPDGARPPQPTVLDSAPRHTDGASAEVAWTGERAVDIAFDEPTVPHTYAEEIGSDRDAHRAPNVDSDEDTLITANVTTGSHSALSRCDRKTRMGGLMSA